MSFSLTTEQQAVVENRGGGLLVSAAAGSGKTRVLVERLLARVEGEGLEIDRFLVITYTKAAAAELRSRIVEELSNRLVERPMDGHLRRQATLVYKAQISTVHAFCSQLLRESGHLLDVNPDFRLADESEAGILMLRALNAVMDARYEGLEEGSDFTHLVDTMSAGRDDARLMQIVLDIRSRVQSHPDPAAWLAGQEKAFHLTGVTDVGATVWGELLLSDARSQGAYWLSRMLEALELTNCDPNLAANYGGSLSATVEGLQAFLKGAALGWDAAAAALPIPFPTAGRKKITDGQEEAELVKAARTKCKKQMEKWSDLFVDTSADLLADMAAVYPAVRGLFALVNDFEAAYTAEKERRGLLDFSDLEHLVVRLLVQDGVPTPLARQYADRYDEIMVDEYQDTNEVQNAIFNALSQTGKNLFMVGDVKQSIYRFRLADPTIFLSKYRAFAPHTQAVEGEPRRIILGKNFRSRPQVLEGANFVFRNIMSAEFGEMDYTEDEALYPGASFPPGEANHAVELDALDLSGEGASEDEGGEDGTGKTAKDLLEARFVARRIRELLDEGFPVGDGEGGLRTVRPPDMVILLRSPGTVLHHYARALGERGIAWEADGGGDFFAATEISVALALLQIVDNPRQDVPLVSVLRSPVYAFSGDRLALLRAACPEGGFYTALEQGAAEGATDCTHFLEELTDLRFGAVDRSCHGLLWHIYDRANLLGVFGAMEGGEERQGNLLTLTELARRFEAAGHKGLFGFLTYLTRLRENGGKITTPPIAREGGGVRIMSIHRSKGLEFPVVFLCGLSRRLNREDMQRPILFHPRLGVGPKRLDTQRMIEYPTLARRAVARQLEHEMMAEELRLLYVAMTRAREKLILTCTLPGGGRDLAKLADEAGCPVEPQVLIGCASVGQWVLLAVLARPEAYPLHAAGGIRINPTTAALGPLWDIRFVDGVPLEQAPPRLGEERTKAVVQETDHGLLTRLTWVYPQAGDVALPSKLTATQLKGREVDGEVSEGAQPPSPELVPQMEPLLDEVPVEPEASAQQTATARRIRARPRFADEDLGLTPAQKGTALHLVMQYLDFDRANTVGQVTEEINRLVRQAFLTPQQGEAVSPKKIVAFFASNLGREMMSTPTLRREFKFSLLVPAAEHFPGAGEEEQVLLQGVVDCCFETLEGLTVVDFKTDRVTAASAQARAENYRSQLAAYGGALERITGKRVVRRMLWFFSADLAVEV